MKANKKVHILKPATWVKYSPSLCDGCWAGCCMLPVQVTPEELFHMGFLKLEQVRGPFKRISQRLMKEGVTQSFNTRTELFTLKRQADGSCGFLDSERRCTIYDRRPSICRRFPDNSKRPGFCPNQDRSQYPEPNPKSTV